MPHTSYKCVPRCHITAPDRLPLHPLFLPSSSPRPFLLSGGRTSARCVFHGLPFHFIETAIRLLHCIINLATVCFFHLKASFLLSQHAFCREVIHSKSIWSLRVRDILFYCFFFPQEASKHVYYHVQSTYAGQYPAMSGARWC